jgi:hypothetical protein
LKKDQQFNKKHSISDDHINAREIASWMLGGNVKDCHLAFCLPPPTTFSQELRINGSTPSHLPAALPEANAAHQIRLLYRSKIQRFTELFVKVDLFTGSMETEVLIVLELYGP